MKIKVFRWIIHACIYLVLITPLLVWGKLLFPYISPKVFFFRIVIEIALFFYILLIIYCPKYRPRFSKLTCFISIYLFLITLSSIFGFDLYRSFWGNIERGEGLLIIYHLFIFFILITSLFRKRKYWFRFFDISILVSLLVALYALGQKFELGFLLQSTGGSRLSSTIGNASFLAAYLLIHIFLCLFFLVQKSKNWRIFYGSVFLFEIYILFQTGTRGAILGLISGLFSIIILSILFFNDKKVKSFFICLLLFLIILSSFTWFYRDNSWLRDNPTFSRLTNTSITDITVQSRLLNWKAATQAWDNRFILGYGYENYNIAFNKYFPALIYRDFDSRLWFDRAHNIIFDQAITGGILGLLSYLSILGLILWILWCRILLLRIKNKKTFYNSFGFIILFSLFVAYFVQNLFVFDTINTYILFYPLLGFVGFLSVSKDKQSIKKTTNNNCSMSFFIIILILLLFSSVYIFNIRPFWSNTISVKGLSYASNNMYRESIIELKKSLNYQTNQAQEIRYNLIKTVIAAYNSNQFERKENKENFDYAINEIEKNFKISPFNVRNHLFAMTIYNSAAKLDPDYYNKVIEIGNRAIELSPTRPQFYFIIGQTKIFQKKFQEGIDCFKKAIELNPSVIQSHWNLAVTYIIIGQNELAENEFIKLEEMGFDYYSIENLQRLSNIYRQIGQIEKAKELEQYLEN